MTSLTIFCVLKPFTDAHIATIQRNALASWTRIRGDVRVLAFGDCDGVAAACAAVGVEHISGLKRGATGRDLMSDAFERAWQISDADLFAYVNADIVLPPDFAETLSAIDCERYFGVGERWDTALATPITFDADWWERTSAWARANGGSPGACSVDYFVHRRRQFAPMPEIYAGSWYSDNYLCERALKQGIPLIDLTDVVFAVHQAHDHAGGLRAWSTGIESMQSKALLEDDQVYNVNDATVRILP